MGAPEIRELLTPLDVAETLKLYDKDGKPSEAKARRVIRKSKIPKVPHMGRLIRIDPDVFDKHFFSGAYKEKK